MNIIETRRKYKIAYKNYISVMWNVWREKNTIKLIFRNGSIAEATRWFACGYASLVYMEKDQIDYPSLNDKGITFTYKGKKVTLVELSGDIGTVFVDEEYKFLDVNNETVIDIGANVGDSTLYFAINNAKKVIALEPYPYSYNIALENIKANHLEDKIILLNAGYGEDSIMKIDPYFENTGSSTLKSSDKGIDIKVISLKTLLRDYNIENAVLKMDCEGCEYNILNEDNNTLKKFKRIQMEYHYGYEEIKKKLEEAGFNVKYTEPKKVYDKEVTKVNHNEEQGYIYAKLSV